MPKPSRRTLSESELSAGSAVGDAGKKGLGLFAQRDFPCGTVVTRMLSPTCITATTPSQLVDWWERHTQQTDVPGDSAIFLYRSKNTCKQLVYDAAFAGGQVPAWYRINHSSLRSNVRPRWCSLKQRLDFVATEDVRSGQEILFSYGQPDPDWDD